jgi:hypothetical protein
VLLVAPARNPQRLPESKVDCLGGRYPSKILDEASGAPGISLECNGYHWNVRFFCELDSDGIELVGIKGRGARCLGKDDNGAAGPQFFNAAFENRRQVITGVRSAHGYGFSRAHDVLENGVVDKALLDDKGCFLERGDDRRQDESFERAHVIADEHAGAVERFEMIHARYFELNADAFQRAECCMAAITPVRGVIVVALCFAASPENDQQKVRVKDERRQGLGQHRDTTSGCPIGIAFEFDWFHARLRIPKVFCCRMQVSIPWLRICVKQEI